MNTRKIRNEKILPDVTKITKVENGQKVPLQPEEQYDEICKAFNKFFEQHVNFGGEFDFFYGLRKDFFTEEMLNRISTYGEIFFDDYIKKIETGKRKIITGKKEGDIQRINRFSAILKREVAKKRKETIKVARRDRKRNPNLVQRIIAGNDEYNYANENINKGVVFAA